MASNVTQSPALADRADIHRSCKSFETLLGALNDYCEAAGAIVTLQKRLVKALRETAGLKVTGEIPANALNTSATIFEALSEIDTKFAKILDKEYDGVSGEVRKWFKKLAKEERVHDERINNANVRIKQAGQVYEKKSKKSARDAGEEHAKYINLLTTLGPEISREKYNHTLQVTQRHSATTYSLAACLSRMADAEWVRTCEGVRRFSLAAGQLGEWRALCEGGWTGPIPQDLPDMDDAQQGQEQPNDKDGTGSERPALTVRTVSSRDSRDATRNNTEGNSPADASGRDQEYHPPSSISPSSSQQQIAGQKLVPTSPGLAEGNSTNRLEPPTTLFDSEMNSGSIRSLSAFPSPPTHFPLPGSVSQQSLSQANSSQSWSSTSAPTGPSVLPSLVESPKQADSELGHGTNDVSRSDHEKTVRSSKQPQESSPETEQRTPQRTNTDPNYQLSTQKTVLSASPLGTPTTGTWRKEDYLVDDHEFGVGAGQSKSNSVDAAKSKGVDRRDTSGSLVTAMRKRYSYTSGTAPPAPKDVPRLPLSVTDLASRYQPVDGSSPPQRRAASPTSAQAIPFPGLADSFTQAPMAEAPFQERSSGGYEPRPTAEDPDIVRRRRQRIEELAELELKEKQLELRAREREIELRTRELERDRVRLMSARGEDMFRGDVLTERAVPGRYSYSTTHLVPPPDLQASSYHGRQPSRSQESSPVRRQPQAGDHAPYCGCDQCSIAKYKTRNAMPSPHDLRPPEKPINLRPEKAAKGNWMRRLSMPVMGNAFSSDSKKSSMTAMKNTVTTTEDGRIVRTSLESRRR